MDVPYPLSPDRLSSPAPYDPIPSQTQITRNSNPVSLDTPTETPHDLFCLAREYEKRGRLPDAADLYLKASMNGHLSAMVSYASHLVPTDERAAFVWFRAAAERGDARAWAELGQLLARGRYFEVNAIDAARCWKRAAQMGDNVGKSALGLCYIRGFGVKQDPERGVEIVRQVADVHNDVTAMKNLAWIYRRGKGVPKNIDQAEYWESRAKKQEKATALISSREQALFGKAKPARRAPKQEDSERRRVKATVLDEHDLSERLRSVEQERARHSQDSFELSLGATQVTEVHPADIVENVSQQMLPGRPKSTSPQNQPLYSPQQHHHSVQQQQHPLPPLTTNAPPHAHRSSSPSHPRNELHRRAVQGLNSTDPDPNLSAAVDELHVTPSQPQPTLGHLHIGEAEVEQVHTHAAQVSARAAAVTSVSTALSADDDTFDTPDQSLKNEEEESPPLLRPAGVLVAVRELERREEEDEDEDEGDEELEDDEEEEDEEQVAEEEHNMNGRAGGGGGDGTRGLPPEDLITPQSSDGVMREGGLVRGNSYVITEGQDDDLDEFEAADMQRITSETPLKTGKGAVAYRVTRQAAANEGRYNVRQMGGYGEGIVGVVELKQLLDLYPRNPLRADSQVPLFHLLNAIQRVPLSDTEAFEMLHNGGGWQKVVTAMASQPDDEFLQEQGLHSMVRLLWTAGEAQRESMVLASYPACYRVALGNEDILAPTVAGIDENAGAAVQAVIHCMRRHADVRRVQLAGCAVLAEMGNVSQSCRNLCLQHGAVILLVACLKHRSSVAAASIHSVACRAVASFCSGKESGKWRDAFATAGGVPELLDLLQLWGAHEDVKSELLSTATKDCCAAVKSVVEGCPSAGGEAVHAFAYQRMVQALISNRTDVAVCTLIIAAMAAVTRSAGGVAEKGLVEAKPLGEVLITMQEHSEQPAFVRKALDLMEALGGFSSMREEIVQAGGIPFAAEIIRGGGSDAVLLERACGVVERLCRGNGKNQEIFIANRGVPSLVALVKSHQNLPVVMERALLALTSVCTSNTRAQGQALEADGVEQVMRAYGVYASKNGAVVAAAASTMASLVVPKNAMIAREFGKFKAPDMVVRAMKRHTDVVAVQENGSAAIASFCEADVRIASTLIKTGLTSVLVVGLQRFLHKQSAVVQIVRAMRALSNEAGEDSYRFKQKLLTDRTNGSSLSEIFHTALAYHKKGLPETGNVIISICATINRLCMRSVCFKNEIGKDGIVEELKRLIEKTAQYKQLGALQPVLATICTLVLDCEENKNRFHAVGGVEAILEVMQTWRNDTYVLEHCCAALRYSCNDHSGNCDEVKNHNGVRSILGVMELHPDNVNVTLWCCLTLADLCKGDEELQSSPNVAQGIRKVVSAMSLFSTNSRFLASACEFLRAASADNVENQERIVRLGGRTAIVKALETHPHDNTLTESGAYALLQVQDVQDARTSMDSQSGGGGLIKRLSKEIRRSSSNKSARSSGKLGGFLGRKSRSFSSKRKQATPERGQEDPLAQTGGEEALPSRPSLINFSRGARSRRKAKAAAAAAAAAAVPDEPEAELEAESEDSFRGGAQDGYAEYDPQPVQEVESGQID